MRKRTPVWTGLVLLSAVVILLVACAAQTQVKVGELVTADQAKKVKNLLPPSAYWRVTHGMSMKVAPTDRIDWPPPYREATEKYSAQVRLSPDRRTLVGLRCRRAISST